ncbi:hypothetical protein KG088_17865 [Halomonas sp. TRM85114]|uniref:hypothetical protein n=1 Tax=Halomonas jincaotanensis TaxID=2810616 RepID=UPI001BD6250D|nr:hypothetical protein [Halomonas jincaotanensis]MBS9405474.1 hypothetical protein [Halomonas jincaotanensis]
MSVLNQQSANPGILFSTVRFIAYVVWAIAGLALWVPLLVRAVLLFNSAMIYATVTQHSGRLSSARQVLEVATTFYTLGFCNIQKWTNPSPPLFPDAGLAISPLRLLAGFICELFWAVSVWCLLLYHRSLSLMLLEGAAYELWIGILIFVAGAVAAIIVMENVRDRKARRTDSG